MKDILIFFGIMLGVFGFVGGLLWLSSNSPTHQATYQKIESVGEFVCVEKFEWFRKNYYKECRMWSLEGAKPAEIDINELQKGIHEYWDNKNK